MIVHIAIPAMNEAEYLEKTLACVCAQVTEVETKLYVCVNQPESYWKDEEKVSICENNQATLKMLENSGINNLQILDRCSKGVGWDGKKFGVGFARKVLMDFISDNANIEDLVVSLDADTQFNPNYIQSLVDQFNIYPKAVAISVPYYHALIGSEAEDRAILRYEIYMRNYAIQMLLIDSPYAFTALGSAMAYRISAYRAIGGMSPMKSGEDFYFLQMLKKYGQLLISNNQKVFPAARFSNRVFFGTGPAMIKGSSGDWSSYPIYHHSLFREVKNLFAVVELLYNEDFKFESKFYSFLKEQFKDENFLKPLRKNAKSVSQFVRAFHTKVDGLRILQFLKSNQQIMSMDDRDLIQENYLEFCLFCNKYPIEIPLIDFSIEDLSLIRDQLVVMEDRLINEKKVL